MLTLLRSDLYRARCAGNSTIKYLIFYIVLICLNYLLFAVIRSPFMEFVMDIMGFPGISSDIPVATSASITYYWGSNFVALSVFMSSLLILRTIYDDEDGGFIRTLMGSRYDKFSYYAEKLILAGVIAAVFLGIGVLMTTLGTIAVGFSFTADDSISFIVTWLVTVWVTSWAMGALTCLIMFVTHSTGAGWIAVFVIFSGLVEKILVDMTSTPDLMAFHRGLTIVTTWLPSYNIELLCNGITGDLAPTAGMTLGLDASLLAHVGACALGTLVIVGVVTFLTQARRDVA